MVYTCIFCLQVYAAKSVNCPLEIYCPVNMEACKMEALESLGVKPHYYGHSLAEAEQKAQSVAEVTASCRYYRSLVDISAI